MDRIGGYDPEKLNAFLKDELINLISKYKEKKKLQLATKGYPTSGIFIPGSLKSEHNPSSDNLSFYSGFSGITRDMRDPAKMRIELGTI